ncbi:fatty acid desaturase [Ruegeria arenilitoris]|uniref:fatty acid desaturase n=1 Tax=Ruegeria arenilitoris TaxID=1173585 RepID=UPI00147D4902|nr:fatty acid desaturase [Ruegeria arenilitoris]
MAYKPLSEATEDLKVQWYRSKMPPERFRELSKRIDRKGWLQAGGHLVLFCLTGAALLYTWTQSWWILFAIALFAHGTVASFYKGTAVHELGHGTVFETKWLNQAFLYLFSLISWWNPFDYAASHTYHHRYTLHPEGDREVLLPIHPNVGRAFLLQMFTFNLFTQPGRTFGKGGFLSTVWLTCLDACGKVGATNVPANEWLDALHRDQPVQRTRSIWWSRLLIAFHSVVLLLALTTGVWVLPLIFTVPSYIANWLSYACGLTQHCGLIEDSADFRKNTRSIRLPKFVEFLYWHMNWHTEHHMYAGVPCYNLPALAKEIENDMPAPRSLQGAWREMLEIWDRQKTDPDYAWDTPLPASAKTKRNKESVLAERSIGDLAPKEMTIAKSGEKS